MQWQFLRVEKKKKPKKSDGRKAGQSEMSALLSTFGGIWTDEKNPLYPDEGFEEFVSRMIEMKKGK